MNSLKLSSKKYLIYTLIIIFIAICLRFFKLAQVPHGMTWDEAAIGYNGYAVWKTRRDEWLVRLPVSFKSFGDFKAPFAIYLNSLFTFLFGMNLWAVRLPFVIVAIFAVWGMMLLTRQLFTEDKHLQKQAQFASIVAGIIMTLSPWHLHFSRAGFESAMTMTYIIFATHFFYKFIQLENYKDKVNREAREGALGQKSLLYKFFKLFRITLSDSKYTLLRKSCYLLFSALLFVIAMYTYHSAKLAVPLLVLFLAFINRRQLLENKLLVLIFSIFGLALLKPLLEDTFMGEGMTRANTLFFTPEMNSLEAVKVIFNNYLSHLDPLFLLFGKTTTLRHGTGRWGVLLPVTFFIALWEFIIYVLTSIKKSCCKVQSRKLVIFAIAWIVIGIFPATLGVEIPHSNRAILALPGFILLATLGLNDFLVNISNAQVKIQKFKIPNKVLTLSVLATVHLLTFLSFQKYYYKVFAKESADAFKDGYVEAFEYAVAYEKGLYGKPEADKILFTSDYGQPYIYALFVRKTNPIWYRGGSLVKYEFTDNITMGDLNRSKTLIVASKDDLLPEERAEKLVYGSDGEVRFKIYYAP